MYKFFAVVIFFSLAVFVSAKNTVYYVNSHTGDDRNNGTSTSAPWKSLQNITGKNFLPGDSILFARGCSFNGGFIIKSSGTLQNNIVISSYGKGHAPVFTNPNYSILNGNVIQITGSYIIIDGLYFEHTANYTGKATDDEGKRGPDRKILLIGAIYQQTQAHHLVIKNSTFNDCPIAVYINGQHNVITHNNFAGCNRFLWAPDWGPIAIVVGNAYNEIAYNTCKNYVSIGGNFGADGGFIELDSRYYGGPIHDLEIHDNNSEANEGFMEVTNAGKNLHVYNNISDDFQQFIFFWSGDSSMVENNTVIRTRPANAKVNVVLTFRKNGFTFRNNIFIVADSLKVFGSGAYDAWNFNQLHEDNLYYSVDGTSKDPIGKPAGKGEIIADPLFVDYIHKDFRLQPNSPAKGKGATFTTIQNK